MTISYGTYGQLKYQIADEMEDRQSWLSYFADSQQPASAPGGYIQNAIRQAIAKWERERFYFNELVQETLPGQASYPWMTQQSQEYYSATSAPVAWSNPSLAQIAKIDKMWVFINGQRYAINPRVFQFTADTSVNPTVLGYPTDFAYSGEEGRFYPIPDGNYPVGVLGTLRLADLKNDTDANAWTTEAFDLIRSEAKFILATEMLYDMELAGMAKAAIYGDPGDPRVRGYLPALKRESARRHSYSRIRPTHF